MFVDVETESGEYASGSVHVVVPLEQPDDFENAEGGSTPDCNSPNVMSDQRARTWCFAPNANPAQRATLDSALSRLRAKGGKCSEIADAAQAMLNFGNLRLHNGITAYYGIATRTSSIASSWATIAKETLDYTIASPGAGGRTLDGQLAHEMDHILLNYSPSGDPHINVTFNGETTAQTVNWMACR